LFGCGIIPFVDIPASLRDKGFAVKWVYAFYKKEKYGIVWGELKRNRIFLVQSANNTSEY